MNDYYVYVYYDPRSVEPSPFYVGKGRKNRYKKHLMETYANTENKKKYAIIQAIISAGMEPLIKFYAVDLMEDVAYDTEKELISRYGRRDLDDGGILTNICEDARPPNNTGVVRPSGKDHHNYGKKLNITDEERKRRSNHYKDLNASRDNTGENNHFYGKKHTEESRAKMSAAAKRSPHARGNHLVSAEARKKIQLNNPNRKEIHTPYGIFISAEHFCKLMPIITANGLRAILNRTDKPLLRQSVANNNLFVKDNIGQTPRELGWYFMENTND